LVGNYIITVGSVLTLELDNANLTYIYSETNEPNIDNLYRSAVKAVYGLADDLDIYLKLGISDGKTEGGSFVATATGTVDDVIVNGVSYGAATSAALNTSWSQELDAGILYGFGLKKVLPLEDDWLVGIDASYTSHKNDYSERMSYVLSGDFAATVATTWNGEMTLQEWQIAPYIAKEIENFVPYLGIKYSDFELEQEYDSGGSYSFDADDNLGIFIGTDYKTNDSWVMNLELRLIDETAVSISGIYSF